MPIHIRRRDLGAGAAWLVTEFALVSSARAQGWPTHPVRIVVPYAPGGSTDTVARITADKLSRMWRQQVVIENKPGGGTNIAAAAVAGSMPTAIRSLSAARRLRRAASSIAHFPTH
jgi:tripartite-type tricarboxylate transporter receptor subunit TctC